MKKKTGAERRRYVRLKTIFPVEFQFIDADKNPTSYIFQGFTRNVGKGGMCIEARTQKGRDIFKFVPGGTKLKLLINIPSNMLAIRSYATVRWVDKDSESALDTYRFGVEYDEIESDDQKMIEQHVSWLHRRPRVLFAFFILLLIITIALIYWAVKPS